MTRYTGRTDTATRVAGLWWLFVVLLSLGAVVRMLFPLFTTLSARIAELGNVLSGIGVGVW